MPICKFCGEPYTDWCWCIRKYYSTTSSEERGETLNNEMNMSVEPIVDSCETTTNVPVYNITQINPTLLPTQKPAVPAHFTLAPDQHLTVDSTSIFSLQLNADSPGATGTIDIYSQDTTPPTTVTGPPLLTIPVPTSTTITTFVGSTNAVNNDPIITYTNDETLPCVVGAREFVNNSTSTIEVYTQGVKRNTCDFTPIINHNECLFGTPLIKQTYGLDFDTVLKNQSVFDPDFSLYDIRKRTILKISDTFDTSHNFSVDFAPRPINWYRIWIWADVTLAGYLTFLANFETKTNKINIQVDLTTGIDQYICIYTDYGLDTKNLDLPTKLDGPLKPSSTSMLFGFSGTARIKIINFYIEYTENEECDGPEKTCKYSHPMITERDVSYAPSYTPLSTDWDVLPYDSYDFPVSTMFKTPATILNSTSTPSSTFDVLPSLATTGTNEDYFTTDVERSSNFIIWNTGNQITCHFNQPCDIYGIYFYIRNSTFVDPSTFYEIVFTLTLYNNVGVLYTSTLNIQQVTNDPVYFMRSNYLPGASWSTPVADPLYRNVTDFNISRNTTTTLSGDSFPIYLSSVRFDILQSPCVSLPTEHAPTCVICDNPIASPTFDANDFKLNQYQLIVGDASELNTSASSAPPGAMHIADYANPIGTKVYYTNSNLVGSPVWQLFPDDLNYLRNDIDWTNPEQQTIAKPCSSSTTQTNGLRFDLDLEPLNSKFPDVWMVNIFTKHKYGHYRLKIYFDSDYTDQQRTYWADYDFKYAGNVIEKNLLLTLADSSTTTKDKLVYPVTKRCKSVHIFNEAPECKDFTDIEIYAVQIIVANDLCTDADINEIPEGSPQRCHQDTPITVSVGSITEFTTATILSKTNSTDILNLYFDLPSITLADIFNNTIDYDPVHTGYFQFTFQFPQDIYLWENKWINSHSGYRLEFYHNITDTYPAVYVDIPYNTASGIDGIRCNYIPSQPYYDVNADAIARNISSCKLILNTGFDSDLKFKGSNILIYKSICTNTDTVTPPAIVPSEPEPVLTPGGIESCLTDTPIEYKKSYWNPCVYNSTMRNLNDSDIDTITTNIPGLTELTLFKTTYTGTPLTGGPYNIEVDFLGGFDIYAFYYYTKNDANGWSVEFYDETVSTASPVLTKTFSPWLTGSVLRYEGLRSNYLPGALYHDPTAQAIARNITKMKITINTITTSNFEFGMFNGWFHESLCASTTSTIADNPCAIGTYTQIQTGQSTFNQTDFDKNHGLTRIQTSDIIQFQTPRNVTIENSLLSNSEAIYNVAFSEYYILKTSIDIHEITVYLGSPYATHVTIQLFHNEGDPAPTVTLQQNITPSFNHVNTRWYTSFQPSEPTHDSSANPIATGISKISFQFTNQPINLFGVAYKILYQPSTCGKPINTPDCTEDTTIIAHQVVTGNSFATNKIIGGLPRIMSTDVVSYNSTYGNNLTSLLTATNKLIGASTNKYDSLIFNRPIDIFVVGVVCHPTISPTIKYDLYTNASDATPIKTVTDVTGLSNGNPFYSAIQPTNLGFWTATKTGVPKPIARNIQRIDITYISTSTGFTSEGLNITYQETLCSNKTYEGTPPCHYPLSTDIKTRLKNGYKGIYYTDLEGLGGPGTTFGMKVAIDNTTIANWPGESWNGTTWTPRKASLFNIVSDSVWHNYMSERFIFVTPMDIYLISNTTRYFDKGTLTDAHMTCNLYTNATDTTPKQTIDMLLPTTNSSTLVTSQIISDRLPSSDFYSTAGLPIARAIYKLQIETKMVSLEKFGYKILIKPSTCT